MKILYFAWLRTRIGIGEEDLEPPSNIQTVGELMAWLRGRGPGYAAAFAPGALVRAAINQDYAGLEQSIAGASEIAFFPPVTGGCGR